MTHRILLAAAVVLAGMLGSGAARAQIAAPGGWYIGPQGGWTMLPDHSFSGSGATGNESYDNGWNAGLRAGYLWGPWRFEGEFSYRRNRLSSANLTAPVALAANPGGDRHSFAEMFNVIYDFSLGWPVTPHLGAGVGVAQQTQTGGFPGPGNGVHSTDTEFAYQGIAGLRWWASPNVAVDLDYRYFATLDPSFTAAGGLKTTSSYGTHNVVASLTMLFGAPPPPPAPAAAPAPPPPAPKVFIVFFDWDKDTITPEGMAIIQQAADAYKAGAMVQIQITGYTDRSGSPGYNQRLSERRANNVAKAMARLGVPPSQMAVSGRGENDNRVPTADGVREPQNRRVEIVFP
jgi:outer membrane protein OmpA-like peptidoglycan-associated protein